MLQDLLNRYPALESCRTEIATAANMLVRCFEQGGKLLACGNGGSCADCGHIVGELMKGFLKKRPLDQEVLSQIAHGNIQLDISKVGQLQKGLPAISLCDMPALNSAFCNDVDADLVYAQAVMGLGREADILLCISTSGNSKNVVYAAQVAKAFKLNVIALTGETGGKLKEIADVCICVTERETYKVQELHLPVYHYLCAFVEEFFFEK